MANFNVEITSDLTIFYIALEQMERCDPIAAEAFLERTPNDAMMELAIEGTCCVIYPSRLLLGFLAECEALGLVD